MSTRPTIKITQELIDRAKPRDSSHCMIAEALQEAFPDAQKISVDLATIRYSDRRRGKRYVILTPPVAQQSLLWFDQADDRLGPFEFKLPSAAQVVASPKKKPGKRGPGATLVNVRGSGVPQKRGGTAPPMGPLAGGESVGPKEHGKRKTRTGRIRGYGLRVMARE